jgi:GntR family transcriptional regulator
MELEFESEKPIFLQLAEKVEDNILKGIYAEETQIPSTTEVAVTLKVKPATANRGVNLLVDEGIVYKKRGVGMFVCAGARKKIQEKRKKAFYEKYVLALMEEAKNLGLTKEDVIAMIDGRNTDERH